MAHANADVAALEAARRVCEHWPELSREDFHALLTPDCEYVNVPMPHLKQVGPDRIHDFPMAFVAPWNAKLSLILIKGGEEAVMVERLERFSRKSGDGPVVELRSMGAFQLRDGKISHWRDYFDPRETQALVGQGPSSLD